VTDLSGIWVTFVDSVGESREWEKVESGLWVTSGLENVGESEALQFKCDAS
jgi:hypothetical protein